MSCCKRYTAPQRSSNVKTISVSAVGLAGKTIFLESGKKVTLNKELGRGNFSVVYEAELCDSDSQDHIISPDPKHCACKIVDYSALKPTEKRWLEEEVEVLRAVKDVKHVTHLESFEKCDNHYFIITSFVEGCDLGEYKEKMRESGELNYDSIQDILLQLLKIVSELHKRGIVHRDIKPENILITPHKGANGKTVREVTLCDFGLSCKCPCGMTMDLPVGTPLYAAPEVFLRRYDHKCDLWSIGSLLLWLTTGNTDEFCPVRMHQAQKRGISRDRYYQDHGISQFSKIHSPEVVINFFRGLCCFNREERLTADQALICPFFSTRFL